MKMPKFHIFPLETPFLRKIQTGVQYFNQNHYTNFNENSLEIRTFNSSPENENWPTDSIFEKILKTLSLHNAKYLTKLDLSIQASSLFKTSTLRKFGLTLAQSFKTLKQLDLRFLSCRKLNGSRNLRYLLDSLTKGMRDLTEVNLYFLACPDVDNQSLKDIKSLILKRCKRLQKLKVVISGHLLDMYDKGFVYFESDIDQGLRNESSLPEFTGQEYQNQITSRGGASLGLNIARYQKNLKSFTFKMSTLQQENYRKLEKDTWKMLAGLSKLENLNYSASQNFMFDDDSISELISIIGCNLRKLQCFSLDFPEGTELTERGYQQLTQNLFSSLPSRLISFALNIEDCGSITDDIIGEISFNIAQNLKNLKTLVLSFAYMDQLTGNALLKLIQIISKYLPSLKKLILSFSVCKGVDPNFDIILPEQLQQFDLYLDNPQDMIHTTWKGLNRLSLIFNDCTEKTSLMDISSKPSLILKNLNELKLIFAQSHKIGNKKIEDLTSAIGTNLESLKSLDLGFSDCSLITDDSLLHLGDNICRKLKNLRHLNFHFYTCGSFYEGGLIYLASIIGSKLKNLESLTLFFYNSLGEEAQLESMLNFVCSILSRDLKKLKKLTLSCNLFQNLALARKIREKLCHIPMLCLY